MRINNSEKHICDLVNCGNLKKEGESYSCDKRKNSSCIFNTRLSKEEEILYNEILQKVRNRKKAFRLVLLQRLKSELKDIKVHLIS